MLSGIQHIEGVSPGRLALTLPFGTFATGLIIGWLWLQTGSIWMVALAHGALNNWGQYAFKFIKGPGRPGDELVLLGVGTLALLIVGSCLVVFGLPRPAAAVSGHLPSRQR